MFPDDGRCLVTIGDRDSLTRPVCVDRPSFCLLPAHDDGGGVCLYGAINAVAASFTVVAAAAAAVAALSAAAKHPAAAP